MSVDINEFTAQMATQMALVQGAISTVGDLDSANIFTLNVVYAATKNLIVPFDDAIAAYEVDIDIASVGGVVIGIGAPIMAKNLLIQADDLEKQGLLVVGRAYVVRTSANIANAPG